jgi:hypothetical protein
MAAMRLPPITTPPAANTPEDLPAEYLCLSPQCGFASTPGANVLSVDD